MMQRPLLRGLAVWLHFHAVNQQDINDLEGIIVFLDDDAPAALRDGDKVLMRHIQRPSIGQVQRELLERPLRQELSNRQCVHLLKL